MSKWNGKNMAGVEENAEIMNEFNATEETIEPEVKESSARKEYNEKEMKKVFYPVTFLSPGTAYEGTLKSKGNLYIAGDFHGDIISEGDLTVTSDISGRFEAGNMNFSSCTVKADIISHGLVTIDKDTTLIGDIHADQINCIGNVTGNMYITGNSIFAETAIFNGDLETGTFSISSGAKLSGNIKINTK